DYSSFHSEVYRICSKLREDGINIFPQLTDDIYRISGYISLFKEISDVTEADVILIPGASGALFRSALWFYEMQKQRGIINKIPRLILVQEEGGDPVVQSLKVNSDSSQIIKMREGLVAD